MASPGQPAEPGAGETPRQSVLVVEDERELALVIQRHVEELGYEVQVASSGERALEAASSRSFDLVLLDIMLPGIDGLDVCRRLRAAKMYMPVIMLTARSSEVDKVLGLETGADDYITKPFGLKELGARIRAMFRRAETHGQGGQAGTAPITVGNVLWIAPDSREVRVRGQDLALTQKEFDLLLHFVRNPGRVYTRAQLLDAVWGYTHDGYEHAVNCHINRLRAKIERDPGAPELLLTAWGVGYKFASGAGGTE